MKTENKPLLLQSVYVILGLTCFMVVLIAGSAWISVHPEASSLIRIGVLIGIVTGILISLVSIEFGKLSSMIYEKTIEKRGVNIEE